MGSLTSANSTGATLRATLLAHAREVHGPVFERYARVSGDDAKLRAHCELIAALEAGDPAIVSARQLADALWSMGATGADVRGVENGPATYVIDGDGNWDATRR